MKVLLSRYEPVWAAEGVETGATEAEAGDAAVAAAAAADEGVAEDGKTEKEAVETIASPKKIGKFAKEAEDKPYWPEDWREKSAAHVAAGDDKVYQKELKRLERITDPTGVYSMARELEAKFSQGGLVKIPGKDAKPEDVEAFNKALGVPEKPEDYFKDIKLENGAVIGEMDKPVADSFAAAVHEAGATPAVVNKAMNWYFQNLEEQAAALDESDDQFQTEARQALKDEYGPAFNRYTGSIPSLFVSAPGGTDVEAEGGLVGRLLSGRMADGKIIGNDPDMLRWLVAQAREINPVATVTEGGEQGGKSLEMELGEIAKFRRENKSAYFKDEKMQARERELIDAQAKGRARA